MSLALDPAWAAGLLLAMTRVAAFVVACPLVPRAVPVIGRVAVVVALGLFLAAPTSGPPDIALLLTSGAANVAVGAALGYLTGLIFHLFAVAGSAVDLSSGLSASALFDPSAGESTAVLNRLFNITALAVFYAVGGLGSLVRGLAASVAAIPLEGGVALDPGLATVAVDLTARLVVAGLELALPALAALFLAEVVLGLASRFAPQANVFLLGLPLKILAALATITAVLLLFPEALGGLLDVVERTFVDGIAGLTPSG